MLTMAGSKAITPSHLLDTTTQALWDGEISG